MLFGLYFASDFYSEFKAFLESSKKRDMEMTVSWKSVKIDFFASFR